jgi:hypothetical protein
LIARGGGSQRRRSWSQHGGGGGDVSVAARRGKEGIERVAVLSGSLTRFQRSPPARRVPALPEAHIDICASSKSTIEAHLGPPKIPEAHINKMRLK